MPEHVRGLRRLSGSRPLLRVLPHLAVAGLLVFTALYAFNARQAPGASAGLQFDVVSAARGAASDVSARSAHFDLVPDPENADPLLSRRILPTPTPAPTPTAAPTAKATPRPVVVHAPVVTAVVGNGSLLWPVPGGVITQYFSAAHLALDIANSAGSPVLAAASGTVIWAGWRTNGGGLVVELDNGNGLHTVYNHLGAMLVGPGAVVARGQQIAKVGCTGNCTGPHVHFQVSINGVFVNPLRYL